MELRILLLTANKLMKLAKVKEVREQITCEDGALGNMSCTKISP